MLKILVSGSHGLIGSQLVHTLETQGHIVSRLVRSRPGANDIVWDLHKRSIEKSCLEGFDAVVHLAGESIRAQRWSEKKKLKILNSRVIGTRLLSETLASLTSPPKVFVSASAIGYYGDRGDQELTESSGAGSGFLADVCQKWEAATASASGIRVVNFRSGHVLERHGGLLGVMVPVFTLGLGGPLGSGNQWVSWISIEDEVAAIQYVIENDSLSGPVNSVAPSPVTNSEFTRTLAAVLRRPGFFRVPKFALAALFTAEAARGLTGSQRVTPAKLETSGFRFNHPELKPTLESILS